MANYYYLEENIFTEEEILNEKSPLKAIKNYCRYNCCVGDQMSWKECPSTNCFLHKFRMGKTGRTRTMTEDQKKEFADRMKNSRDITT